MFSKHKQGVQRKTDANKKYVFMGSQWALHNATHGDESPITCWQADLS